jgi:hypothetical protein
MNGTAAQFDLVQAEVDNFGRSWIYKEIGAEAAEALKGVVVREMHGNGGIDSDKTSIMRIVERPAPSMPFVRHPVIRYMAVQ